MAEKQDPNRSGAPRSGTAARMSGATSERKTPWGIIVVALVAVGGVVWFLSNDPMRAEREFGKSLESQEGRSNSSSRGQRGGFTLADSTAVTMGAETSIRIPPSFPAKNRGVGIVGTAKFKPTPATGEGALPFRVRSRKVHVASTGASFVVTAFPEDKAVMIKALDGSVTVHPNAEEEASQEVAAGPGIAVSDDGTARPLTQEESDAAFSWVDGTLTVNNMPLSQTLPLALQRWYNTNAAIGDKSLESRPVTAKMNLESSKTALEMINAATSTHIEFRGDTLTLVDGAPKPTAAPAKKK